MPSTNLKKRIGFLCSGNGAIFRKVCGAVNRRWLRSDLVICIVNRPCPSEGIAGSFGIPIVRVHRDRFRDRLAFSNEILEHLQHYEVDVVGLTFDSLLAGPILERYRWRMINVHPGLLPAFPGLSAVRKTREAGVLYGGGTIHFLDEKMDRGTIISQGIAAIRPGEDLAVYDKAAFDCCWRQLVQALSWFEMGRIQVADDSTVVIQGGHYGSFPISPALEIPELLEPNERSIE